MLHLKVPQPTRRTRLRFRGFTLAEALMAAAVLSGAATAVAWAVTSGQQHAYEAHARMRATMAADERMGSISTLDYDSLAGQAGFGSCSGLPCVTTVVQTTENIAALGIDVRGRTVTVKIYNSDLTVTLAEISRFFTDDPS